MKRILLLLLILSNLKIFSQNVTVYGYIKDISTGECVSHCNIFDTISLKGTAANSYGYYCLTLIKAHYEIKISHIGYMTLSMSIDLEDDTCINIYLIPNQEIEEVEIIASRNIYSNSVYGENILNNSVLTKIPVFFGEKDIIRTIHCLPGINKGMEGMSGIFVRGGTPDQNLFLLDNVPVYNVNHLFGVFSVFNDAALNNSTIYKSYLPARYNGCTSSIIDLKTKEGNLKKMSTQYSIGNLSGVVMVEGPIIKNKSSFIINARRTYWDILLLPVFKTINKDITAGYYFFDFNSKINYSINDNNTIFLSLYAGKDKGYFNSLYEQAKEKALLRWGNITSSLRYYSIINSKIFTNTTLYFTEFNFITEHENFNLVNSNKYPEAFFKYKSEINDLGIKSDWDIIMNKHYIKSGISFQYHKYTPEAISIFSKLENVDSVQSTINYSYEYNGYLESKIDFNRIKVNMGANLSIYFVDRISFYSLQPRFSFLGYLTNKISIRLSYSRMSQNMHLLVNSLVGLPTDLWVQSTKNVPPVNADQLSVNIKYNIIEGSNISVEGYYKKMENLIEYKDGAGFSIHSSNWEENIEVGKGDAYGIETLLEKNSGNFTGLCSYTLSWATRSFENINQGKKYYFKYDRRHNLSFVLDYQLKKGKNITFNWSFYSGHRITIPESKYINYLWLDKINESFNYTYFGYFSSIIENIPERNNYVLSSYHRLDISFNTSKKLAKGTRTWNFGLYNVYNRKNTFAILTQNSYYGNTRKIKKISGIPILPYIVFNRKF